MKGVYKRADPGQVRERLAILRKMQALPLAGKIAISERVIARALAKGPGAVLYSGGRDSTVLLALVARQSPAVLVIYNDTTLGAPGLLDAIRVHCEGLNYVETTAADPVAMWQAKGYYPLLSKRGFTAYKKRIPGLRVGPVQCCYNLKERYFRQVAGAHRIAVAFWGNRAAESMRRRLAFADNGFLFDSREYRWAQAYPLQHWRAEDITQYLERHIPSYAHTQEPLETGCLCCGTDITHWPNNLGRLYQRDRAAWERYMRAGFAEQILRIKGGDPTPADVKNVIRSYPQALLRV